jgi:outer membrane protein assembly factor BamB
MGNPQAFLLKLYSNGTTQWNTTFNATGWSSGMEAQQTSDGGYISTVYASWALGYDLWLWKVDANGATLWTKPVGGGINVFYVQQTADGDYMLAGFSNTVSAVLIKVSDTPPLFSPEVILIMYIASLDSLVAATVSGIVLYHEPRKEHAKHPKLASASSK